MQLWFYSDYIEFSYLRGRVGRERRFCLRREEKYTFAVTHIGQTNVDNGQRIPMALAMYPRACMKALLFDFVESFSVVHASTCAVVSHHHFKSRRISTSRHTHPKIVCKYS